jgi:hypothetical protein
MRDTFVNSSILSGSSILSALFLFAFGGGHGIDFSEVNTRFAWAGGTCPRFAWAGGIFSPVILLCPFLVLAGNRFWFYILLMYGIVPYSCGVVLVFLVLAGNSFWC